MIRKLRERATLTSEIGPSALLKNDSGDASWSRLVLLTNFIYWKDAAYFVDGSRGRGLFDPSTSDCGR